MQPEDPNRFEQIISIYKEGEDSDNLPDDTQTIIDDFGRLSELETRTKKALESSKRHLERKIVEAFSKMQISSPIDYEIEACTIQARFPYFIISLKVNRKDVDHVVDDPMYGKTVITRIQPLQDAILSQLPNVHFSSEHAVNITLHVHFKLSEIEDFFKKANETSNESSLSDEVTNVLDTERRD
jgi:sucrose-6-phosphate hydrolase SacC (GH32 family)